ESQSACAYPFGRDAAHLCDLFGCRGLAVSTALTHHEQPDGAVTHLGGEVDVVWTPFEGVEVLRDAPPVPRQTFVQRGAGDVFDTLHQLDQLPMVGRPHRREADPTVAHDDRRHAVTG